MMTNNCLLKPTNRNRNSNSIKEDHTHRRRKSRAVEAEILVKSERWHSGRSLSFSSAWPPPPPDWVSMIPILFGWSPTWRSSYFRSSESLATLSPSLALLTDTAKDTIPLMRWSVDLGSFLRIFNSSNLLIRNALVILSVLIVSAFNLPLTLISFFLS